VIVCRPVRSSKIDCRHRQALHCFGTFCDHLLRKTIADQSIKKPQFSFQKFEALSLFLDSVVCKRKEAPSDPQFPERCLVYQSKYPLVLSALNATFRYWSGFHPSVTLTAAWLMSHLKYVEIKISSYYYRSDIRIECDDDVADLLGRKNG
jgi:hypothetical protein